MMITCRRRHILKPFGIALCVIAGGILLQTTAHSDEDPAPQETPKAEDNGEEAIDYKTLKNPVPFTKSSIKSGKGLYVAMCGSCHGADGRALVDMFSAAVILRDWLAAREGGATPA